MATEPDPLRALMEAAQQELREKEAFNFALFQHNPAAMVVVDRAGRVIKSNLARRALELPLPALGCPLFDAAGADPEPMLHRGLADAIRSGAAVQAFPDIAYLKRRLTITIAPFQQGAVVIYEDITERKRAQAEAEERQKQLIQADKMIALGTLVSGVAHEISNPNNVLLLSAGVLRRSCSDIVRTLDRYQELEGDFDIDRRPYHEMREEFPGIIDTLVQAGERIRALVDDLKTFARKGTESLNESVDVNRVVDAAVKLLHPLVRKACHRFSVVKAPTLPSVRGNAQNLEQVVINLLSNACQALKHAEQAVTLTTACDAATGDVLIEVRDEGAGIPPEILDRITDPFFTTRQDEGGTGLGLSISRTIVENHKGRLAFASQCGQGTVATVRLPADKAATPAGGTDRHP